MSKSTKSVEQFNFFTGYKYQGINATDLSSKGYKSNEWATYKQWFEHGQQVQKGNHGTSICVVYEQDGKKKAFYTKVFNREQVAPVEVTE